MTFKNKLTPKSKRIINIVVDVIVAIILAFALFLAVCTISSKAKGYDQYTEIFGSAYLGVESTSMEPTFNKGDLIKIKTVSGDEAKNLKEEQIITFKTKQISKDGKWLLNTHRIVAVIQNDNGEVSYRTKGDNLANEDSKPVSAKDVVGVYQGKASGVGKVFLFMNTSAGFFVCVVLPTLLIVVYCAVNLVLVIRKEKKKQTVEAELAKIDEREKIRQELLAEMQANQTAEAPPEEIKETGQGNGAEELTQPSAEKTNAEKEEK